MDQRRNRKNYHGYDREYEAKRRARRAKSETAGGVSWAHVVSGKSPPVAGHGFQLLHCSFCGDTRLHKHGVCVSVGRHT